MAEFSASQFFENENPVVKSIYDRIVKESRIFSTIAKKSIYRQWMRHCEFTSFFNAWEK